MSRTLPHSTEAEAAVLGGVLLRNDALNEVMSVVSEDDFYVPAHRSVYRGMLKLFEQQRPIDVVTLEHQLKAVGELGLIGGIESLGKLADRYASSHNIVHHAELVRQTAARRNLVIAARDIADEGMGDLEDVTEFIDSAERRILEVNQRGRRGDYRSARELVEGVFREITDRARRKNPITGVPTRYPKFDEMTGGLQPGDLIVLAARPSMGKTAFALNIAQNACIIPESYSARPPDERPSIVPVLFFSLEMSAAQLVERILCSEARVDASRLRSGRLVEEEFTNLVRAADRVFQAPLYIDDSAAPTILEIRARARRFRQDRQIFPPGEGDQKDHGLIVVDYMQLCRGGRGRYDSREQEISEISRGLKSIAKELRMPVMALSQLNRAVDSRADHRPQLSDLRESGAIEQDADVIAFIYREERYLTDEDKRREVEGKAEVIVGKQRNGPTGTVHLTFVGKHTRFENPAFGES